MLLAVDRDRRHCRVAALGRTLIVARITGCDILGGFAGGPWGDAAIVLGADKSSKSKLPNGPKIS